MFSNSSINRIISPLSLRHSPTTKISDLLVKALENEGVEYIFGIPGEENLDFLNSLKESTQIKLILTRHERAAGFMAATYGRLTGKTGVCLSTLGPGATNFVTAAAYAQLCAIERSDLIINVGHDVVEKPPFFMEKGGKKVIHVNFMTAQVYNVYFPQVEVIGDIATTINRLSESIGKDLAWDNDYFSRVKVDVEKYLTNKDDDSRFPIVPQRLVADVRRAMPSDGIVCLDNGIYKVWFARNYKAHQPNTLLLDNALATMGAGLPSAMGAKMVFPDRKVMAVCGDGGFMMNSQELETAVRLGLNLVVLILRDNAYGMIKWKQTGMGFETFGLDYGNPDFVEYAQSYGARGVRVESVESFLPTLEEALNNTGVTVIELPVDYSENEKTLIEELEQKTCLL